MLFYQGSGFHNQNTERVKNLPFIWLNWILLEMHWNTNMFRINFKINCKCKVMILKIARVQNSALHRAFTMQKKKLDEERGSNERQLFLGISGSKRQHINETGFCHLKTKKVQRTIFTTFICTSYVFTLRNNSTLSILKYQMKPQFEFKNFFTYICFIHQEKILVLFLYTSVNLLNSLVIQFLPFC